MGTSRFSLRLVIAAAIAAAAATPAAAQDQGRIFSTQGNVGETGEDEAGLWFELFMTGQRFRLPRGDGRLDEYMALILAASERGFGVRVRYDGLAGVADAEAGRVLYPLCSLSVGDVAPIGDEARNCPAQQGEGAEAGGANQLGQGLALARSDPEAARRLLAEALEDRTLAAPLRALALQARGEAAEALAERETWAGEAYDRLHAEALSDYRGWFVLLPEETEAQFAIGRMLLNLGGYEDAIAVYRAIGRRWPERSYEVAIRIGAVYRQQGDNSRALRALDEWAEREGPAQGMRFHYHRGWTLMLLERFEESVEEVGRGLESQPDYSSAYQLRSCANARLGRVADALRDQERAVELITLLARDYPEQFAESLARARTITGLLSEAATADPTEAVPAACEDIWDDYVSPRARSAQLPSRAL